MIDKNSGPGNPPEDETPANTDQGSILSVDSPASDVEDTADGGAIVKTEDPPPAPADQGKFYANLVDLISPITINSLGTTFDELVKKDRDDRKGRDKKYAEGIQRTGLGDEAPGGADFAGASKAVHPVLSKAIIDFEARAIAELMPPAGPVKAFIPETNVTQAAVDKGRRVASHMNWQLTKQMPEFRPELEQCLTQVPLGGSQFMYGNFDEKRRRPVATYWPSDDVLIPYSASSALMAERLTMVERISQRTYEQRVKSGYYIDTSGIMAIDTATQLPEQTAPAKAAEKVEGVKPDTMNKDGLRQIWRIFTELELEDDPLTKGDLAPYVIEMVEDGSSIKRIIRNWQKKDETRQPMTWLVEFPFLPWRGALSIGLGHVIGSLSGAATGALRALLDSAHVNNFPATLRLKGANMIGQTVQMGFGSSTEIEGGVGGVVDDIRKLIMPLPYNPTSPVLLELLGVLVNAAEDTVATTLKNLAESAQNGLPVGTTLAIIEQGIKVFAGVHMRLLGAMTQFLQVLWRINQMYITDEEIKDDAGTLLATRADYNGPMNVIPVADPNIFSDAQRFAQMQVVADRAQGPAGQLYDQRKVEEMILKMTRIPDATGLLLPATEPKEQNAVNENAAMAMGQPVSVFPDQDHLAHLQVLLDFAQSPFLGQMPNIAAVYLPHAIKHAADHIAMWYVQGFQKAGDAAVQGEITKLMDSKDPEANAELDKLLATISPAVVKAAGVHFAKVEKIMEQLQQVAAKFMPPAPPPDPSMAVAQVGAETTKAVAGMKSQDAAATNASREKVAQLTLVGKSQDSQGKLAADAQANDQKARAEAALQTQKDDAAGDREQRQDLNKQVINEADNRTAETIAAAQLASSHKPTVSTGTGINP